jgi:beta-glucanase (GH16 family)
VIPIACKPSCFLKETFRPGLTNAINFAKTCPDKLVLVGEFGVIRRLPDANQLAKRIVFTQTGVVWRELPYSVACQNTMTAFKRSPAWFGKNNFSHSAALRGFKKHLTCLALMAGVGVTQSALSLVPNGNFELAGGTSWVFAGGGATINYSTNGGNVGGFADMNSAGGWGVLVSQASPTEGLSLASLGLTAGSNYTFSLDMKSLGASGVLAGIKIEAWNAGSKISDTGDRKFAVTTSWATYTTNWTIPPTATSIMFVPLSVDGGRVGFDNVGVGVSDAPLTVSISSPVNGATVASNFTINATATASPATVTNVSFYDGNTLLGSDTNSPFDFSVSAAALGAHALKAIARDSSGNSATSSVVNVTVSNAPPLAGWQLAWSDEFTQANGTSPDSSKWTNDIGGGGWGNGELQYYTARTNNARIENGQLVIEAKAENYNGSSYTSARLLTQNKWAWTYGRMEARIKIARTQGIWPAFWMLGTNIPTAGWPACGEIDIMECIGSEPKKVYGTIHGPGYSGGGSVGGSYTFVPDVADDFRIFAVEWTTNQIKWFVDGTNYFTVTPASLGGNTWVFDHHHFFLLNVAVGGAWPGYPDGTTILPQKMLVDYVRVYTNAPVAPTIPAAPGGLRASPGSAKAFLSWDSVAGATGYHVKRATSSGGPYTTIATSPVNNYTDASVANCSTYHYVVAATNSAGASTNSTEASAVLGAFALAVKPGGSAVGQFVLDAAYVTGGAIGAVSPATIDTSGLAAPAPQEVYQSERYGNFTYTFTNLISGANYKVRLHSAETYWTAVGQRRFNVTINGSQVLTNFDIIAAAGAANKAVINEFNAVATGGKIAVQYVTVTDNARANGIEIILPQPAAPAATNNGPLWSGMTLNLTASTVPGASYSWSGPNGFASTNQNPAITPVTPANSGLYAVTATTDGCVSTPATTAVTVNPPASMSIQPVAGTVILDWPAGTLQTATNITGPWGDVSGAVSPHTNPTTAPGEFFRIKLQ